MIEIHLIPLRHYYVFLYYLVAFGPKLNLPHIIVLGPLLLLLHYYALSEFFKILPLRARYHDSLIRVLLIYELVLPRAPLSPLFAVSAFPSLFLASINRLSAWRCLKTFKVPRGRPTLSTFILVTSRGLIIRIGVFILALFWWG